MELMTSVLSAVSQATLLEIAAIVSVLVAWEVDGAGVPALGAAGALAMDTMGAGEWGNATQRLDVPQVIYSFCHYTYKKIAVLNFKICS